MFVELNQEGLFENHCISHLPQTPHRVRISRCLVGPAHHVRKLPPSGETNSENSWRLRKGEKKLEQDTPQKSNELIPKMTPFLKGVTVTGFPRPIILGPRYLFGSDKHPNRFWTKPQGKKNSIPGEGHVPCWRPEKFLLLPPVVLLMVQKSWTIW